MSSLLSLSNLRITFDTPRGQLAAVRGVDLEILVGESLGVVGESGSGKTVLSRASMGLLTMSTAHRTGTVVFDGQDLSTASREAVRDTWGTGMAMIFQDPMTALNPVRRIGSQLSEGLRVRLGMSRKEAKKRSIELLQLVRIPDPEKALRKFKKKISDMDVLQEVRDREQFLKPTVQRKLAKSLAKRRWQKYLRDQSLPKKLF